MSSQVTHKRICDECDKEIKDGTPFTQVAVSEFTAPPAPDGWEGEWVAPVTQTLSATLDYHEGCFDRQKALAKKNIDKAVG